MFAAEDDSMWETAKYVRRMEKRLKAHEFQYPFECHVFRYGTHFIFPQSLLTGALPVGNGLLRKQFNGCLSGRAIELYELKKSDDLIKSRKENREMKDFLIEKLGQEKGNAIYALQQKRLAVLTGNIKNKSRSQTKTLSNTILPRVALYQILCEDHETANLAEELLREYMCGIVGKSMHEKYSKMERVPFFYGLYSHVFLQYMKKSDLWDCEMTVHTKDRFGMDIHRCLWHDACTENGCPELCRYFCMCDDITYGGLEKMGFQRTQTLGMQGEKCDFVFYKKKPQK